MDTGRDRRAVRSARAGREIHVLIRQQSAGYASDEYPGAGNGGRDRKGNRRRLRPADFSVEPTRLRHDTLSQIRSGGVEFFTLSGLILATLVPPASINGMGFAFPNYDTVWKAMDGDLGAYVRGQIAKTNQILVMEKIWDNGFRRTTTSTKPIKTPDDFRGMKLRVPPSPLWTSMFKAFDAAPASINFNEVYSALFALFRLIETGSPRTRLESGRHGGDSAGPVSGK